MRGGVLKMILTPSRRVEQRTRREKIEKDDRRTEQQSSVFIDRGPIKKMQNAYVRCCSAAIVNRYLVILPLPIALSHQSPAGIVIIHRNICPWLLLSS